MGELINEHVKSEFKKFFKYVFKVAPYLWSEHPILAEIFNKDVLTEADNRAFNRVLSSIVQSEISLSGILGYSDISSAHELRYYAYLFLKDMQKTERIDELGLSVTKLKTASEQYREIYDEDLPAEFINKYDNLNALMDIIKNNNMPYQLRSNALDRARQLSPLNNWSMYIFNKTVFDSERLQEWMERSKHVEGLRIIGIDQEEISQEAYNQIIINCIKQSKWGDFRLHVEGSIKTSGKKPSLDYRFKNGMLYFTYYYLVNGRIVDSEDVSIVQLSPATGKPLADMANKIINEEWIKYRKEQDEDYPARLVQYEKSLEAAVFSDSAIARAGDFYDDDGYIALKNKLGEVKANELWNSPENLLLAIEGKFSGEWKNLFANRLFDISIVTLEERKRVAVGLRHVHIDMFFGESFEAPLVDTNLVELVDKSLLLAKEDKKDEL